MIEISISPKHLENQTTLKLVESPKNEMADKMAESFDSGFT